MLFKLLVRGKKIIYFFAFGLLLIPMFYAKGKDNLMVIDCYHLAMLNQFDNSAFLLYEKNSTRCEQWITQALGVNPETKYHESLSQLVDLGNYNAILQIFQNSLIKQEYEKATYAAQALYDVAPERSTSLIAEFYWKEIQKSEVAVLILNNAISSYPDSKYSEDWWILLGKIRRSQQLWEESLTAYRKAFAINSQNDQALVEIGRIYYLAYHDLDNAMNYLEEAIQLQPEKGTAYFVYGELLSKEKRYTEALPWFQAATSRTPNALDWYILWGQSAQKAGDLILAKEIYQKAINNSPNFAAAYYELSWIFYLLDQSSSALDAIDKAIAFSPQEEATYYLRAAKLHEWAGDNQQAVALYKQALKLSPNLVDAKKSLENIESLP